MVLQPCHLVLQLKLHASPCSWFLCFCVQARIITEASYPYKVVFANHAWEELCGWNAEEVKGQHGLSFLQGPETEKLRLKRVSAAVKYGEVGGMAAHVSALGLALAGACRCCMAGWLAGWCGAK